MLRSWIAASVFTLLTVSCAFAGVNTWTGLGPQGGDVRRVVMHPTDPNLAVAIAVSGVYRTTNGGATWTQTTSYQFQNPPYELLVDPDDPNRLYVFSYSNPHIVVSTDGGVTFQPLNVPPVTNVFEPRLGVTGGGVMYYTAGLRVFYSDDRAANWAERTAILLPGDARISMVVVDPTDANTVYALAGASPDPKVMFVSQDGADTWTQLGTYVPEQAIQKLVPNPAVPGEVWAGRFDGLWKSEDYGEHWTNIPFSGSLAVTSPIADIALNVRGGVANLIVTSYSGVFRSSNGGSSWSDITGDLRTGPRSIATHPLDPDVVMLSGEGLYVPGTSPGTWVERHNGIIASSVWNFEADPTTDRIYGFSGVIHASTGGNEFLRVNDSQLATIGTPPVPKMLTAIHAQPGSLLALLSEELARSDDGGATWTLVPGFPSNRMDQLWQVESARADPLNLLVSGTEGVYRSANGGASWTQVTSGLPADFSVNDFEFSESNPSIVYLSPSLWVETTLQGFGVYRSSDGGTNWAPANAGIEELACYDIEVDPTDAQIVYAIADTSFVKSTDGGTSWRTLRTSLSSGARIAIDPVTPRIIYVVHYPNEILRSVNGGESFEVMRNTSMLPWWDPRAVIVDPLRPNIVKVGTGGFGVQQMSVEPDIALEWSATPDPATAGSTLSYTLFAKNHGPYASSGARVSVQLPTEITELMASTQGGTCTTQQTTAVCTLNPLAAHASIGITLSARAQSAGAFAVNANIVGDQPDPVSTNNTISHSVQITSGSPPVASPSPTPAPSGGGGGGGGGSMSILLLLLALGLRRTSFDIEQAER